MTQSVKRTSLNSEAAEEERGRVVHSFVHPLSSSGLKYEVSYTTTCLYSADIGGEQERLETTKDDFEGGLNCAA